MTPTEMRGRRVRLSNELARRMEQKESLARLIDGIAKEIERLDIEITVGGLIEDMAMTKNPTFEEEFSRLDMTRRRRFRRAGEVEQRDVVRQYERHRLMCEKHEIDVDPLFLREAVMDMELETV